MTFILGKKLGMSQIFKEDGTVIPVTVIEVEPNTVTQVKVKDKDGYEAVQIAAGTKKVINKAQRVHFKNLTPRFVKETKVLTGVNVGDKLNVSMFSEGDIVKVSGVSKGKGFQGVVKRHGFSGMPFSHGHHHVLRHAGSIGQRFPQHTLKGMRMPGRMGYDKLTVRGLKVVAVDKENNILAIKGAVPGNRGSIVMIQSQ